MEITNDTLTQAMLASNAATSLSRPMLAEQRQAADAVKSINQTELFGSDRQLTYSQDPKTRENVMKVVSKSTGETIAQLPPEIALQISAYLQKS